jgi:hypothetical protein
MKNSLEKMDNYDLMEAMKRLSYSTIILAAALAIFAIATWLALQTPSAPSLPPNASSSTTTSGIGITTAPQPQPGTDHLTIINITNPTSSTRWVIGKQNTITWSKAGGITGQMYLVNATSGAIVGWIQQNIAPNQTYFPWSTDDVFLSHTNPTKKNILPGEYIIKMSFESPNVLPVISAPFFITAE